MYGILATFITFCDCLPMQLIHSENTYQHHSNISFPDGFFLIEYPKCCSKTSPTTPNQ